jgi:outer membrane protein assembly factor BamB
VDSRFQQGNLLVCFRNVNQIAVLEKNSYRILWAWGEGELEWPHHSTMLLNGHILVFDNGVIRKYSRVVELNPLAGDIVWEYTSEPPEDFYSKTRGSCQRLPNGNTLICDSNKGRVFEVTQEGEMVWTWLNPDARGGHRETVYRMMRLPPAQVDQFLKRRW